jgi:lipoate---protein ligase
MIRIDGTYGTLAENLALDEALLLAAQEGGPEALRFWEWPTPAVVLGLGGSVAIDVIRDRCEADGVPILRRSSGGGTVLLGTGCLMYSLILTFDRAAELRDVNASYRWILGKIATALAPFAAVEFSGTCDLSVGGRKFSGNAQQRKSNCLLHHGTILYGYDLPQISMYLHAPERTPGYRRDRPHDDFVINLPGADFSTICDAMAREFPARSETPSAAVMARIPDLLAAKYANPEWIFRR